MAEMPSIMMLFWLAPPSRVPPAEVPPAVHARSKGHQTGEVPAVDRQVLDLFGGDGERPLAALRLHERRLGGDGDRFGGSAHFEREWRHADTVAAADHDPRALQGLERRGVTSTVYVSGVTFGNT